MLTIDCLDTKNFVFQTKSVFESMKKVILSCFCLPIAIFCTYPLHSQSDHKSEEAQLNGGTEPFSPAIDALDAKLNSNVSAAGGTIEYLHVFSTGQSLALGFTSVPPLSTTQAYNVFSLSPALSGYDPPMIPLVETLGIESPSSGLANTLHVLDSLNRPILFSMHASSGSPYVDLKKGTFPWIRAMAQVTNAKAEVEALPNAIYRPIGVTVVHGEADNDLGNAPLYQSFLEEWQRDYESDISAILGDTINFPLFVSQMNTGWTGEMAVAQYKAHKDNPGKIILVGPKYQYEYSDQLHLRNYESKNLGELLAKVIHEVAVKGNTWNPLMPNLVSRNSNIITVDFHIPVGALVLDTTTVAMRPDFGFEFAQTGGNAVTIDSVSLINNNSQVQITLSAEPTGTDQLLRYAYTCGWSVSGYATCGNSQDSTFNGGNIRDMDNSVSTAIGSTGLPLHNWCVAFEEPVQLFVVNVEEQVQPRLNVTPNPGNTFLKLGMQHEGGAPSAYTMSDLSGKVVSVWPNFAREDVLTVSIEGLPQGLYFITGMMEDGRKVVAKVIVE